MRTDVIERPHAGAGRHRVVRVLVVEDSPDHVLLIERALRAARFDVAAVGTGEEALDRLADADVVLIDHRLPLMSGIDLLRSVVSLADGPAPVIVTATGSQELVVEALRLGAIDYVVKSAGYLGDLPAVVARAHRQHDLARRYRELQRFAVMVHEPTVRADAVNQIVTGARRLLGADGVVLLRRRRAGGWEVAARAGDVDDIHPLRAWLDARERRPAPAPPGVCMVELPLESDELPGMLVLVGGIETPLAEDERELAATFAAFAASALRQIHRLELERGLIEQLQQSVRARQDFLASVSHELRTPLTVIAGYAETLIHRSAALEQKTRDDLLGRIDVNAQELRRLIDQLLDAAAVEHGSDTAPRLVSLDLRDAVLAALAEASFLLDERPGARDVPSVRVKADPDLVRRTVVNLVSNACKYSPAASPVSLRAVVDEDHVRVEVSDEGVGVAPSDHDRVFEPFWRAEHAVAGAVRGTGIGLSLVRHYIRSMGGTVGVQTAGGPGSTFWFTLPLARSDRSGTTLP